MLIAKLKVKWVFNSTYASNELKVTMTEKYITDDIFFGQLADSLNVAASQIMKLNEERTILMSLGGQTSGVLQTQAFYKHISGTGNNAVCYLIGSFLSTAYTGGANSTGTIYYINENNEYSILKRSAQQSYPEFIALLYDGMTASEFSLTLNGTNQQQISVNGVNYSTFPQTITISSDTTITATGNPNRTITLQNEQNLKQVQIGSTIYNNFPVSIPIPSDTIIRISGKDDPQITVDYTHTTVPIVTNI